MTARRSTFIGVLLGIAVLELMLRLTEDGRPWKRAFREDGAILIQRAATEYDGRTRFRFTPGWSGRFYFSGSRDFVPVRVNSLGFVSPEYPEAKPAGTMRVALIGDSMVDALQVEPEARFRTLVEGALATAGPAQVLNFGLPGTGPVTSLGEYRDFARRFRPDAVVVGIYTDNDFADDAGIAWRSAGGGLIEQPFAHAPGDLGKFLKANSCLVMAAWALGPGRRDPGERKDGASATAATASELEQKSSSELAGVPGPAFEEAIAAWEELIAEVSADGAQAIIVLFPDHATFTEDGGWDYARPGSRLLHERLARHFAQRGVGVITGSELLRRYTEQHGASAPFATWKSYLSREAHQTLAALIVEQIHTARPDRRAAAP